jgi:hypothetical protein
LLATLLTLLALLSTLALLLPLLALLLALLALLPLPALKLLLAHAALGLAPGLHLLQLLPQALHLRQGLLHGLGIFPGLGALRTRGHGLRDAFQLIAQLVESLRHGELGHHGILAHALAEVLGVALHVSPQLGLLHVAQRFAHTGSRLALGAHEIAHGVLHARLKLLQVLGFRVLLVGQLARLLLGEGLGVLCGESAPHLLIHFGLPARQFFRLASQLAHLTGGLLAA